MCAFCITLRWFFFYSQYHESLWKMCWKCIQNVIKLSIPKAQLRAKTNFSLAVGLCPHCKERVHLQTAQPHNPAVDSLWHAQVYSRSMEPALGFKGSGTGHRSSPLERRSCMDWSCAGRIGGSGMYISLQISPVQANKHCSVGTVTLQVKKL